MNGPEIVKELAEKYPGKNIIQLPPGDPTEIICEVEPTSDHPEYSIAVAVVDESAPHKNREKETYDVLRGNLVLRVADQEILLKEGDSYVIQSGTIHSVKANAAWVRVITQPGWTPEGHILVQE